MNFTIPEIQYRLNQIAWNSADRFRLLFQKSSSQTSPSQTVPEHHFFWEGSDVEEIKRQYAQNFPSWRSAVLQRADQICEHRFNLLGYSGLRFAGPNGSVDWHLDPVHQVSSPREWWQKMRPLSWGEGDAKVIWELGRHSHLVDLAKAFRISGDEKYLTELKSQLNSWMDDNPPKKGIHWTSSLELAVRLIAWAWVYYLVDGEKQIKGVLADRFFYFMEEQANHIEHNLSFYFSPNTHLTGEALGLFYTGLLFPHLKRASGWRELGKKILIQTMGRHVLSDGGYIERSLWYHRYTLDIYLHFFLLCRRNQISLPPEIRSNLIKLMQFMTYAAMPGGKFPLFGDDDGGRLLTLDDLAGNDLKGLFSTTAVLFENPEFKFLSQQYQEETLWLVGSQSRDAYSALDQHCPVATAAAFKETGYFFMRQDWTPSAAYLVFDGGPHGWLNGGHAHADTLSFQINAGGEPLITDSGTYAYHGRSRNLFRGPDAHAIIKVNSYYPSIPSRRPFHWEKVSSHLFRAWETHETFDYVCSQLTGDMPWSHARHIFFIKPDLFLVVDRLEGTGEQDIEMRFPLHGIDWQLEKRGVSKKKGAVCRLENQSGVLAPQMIPSWTSACYGAKLPALTLLFKGRAAFPFQTSTLIHLSNRDYRLKSREDRIAFELFLGDGLQPVFHYGDIT